MQKSCAEVERFKAWLEAAGKSTNTIKTYAGILEKFADWLADSGGDLANVTRFDVQTYIKALERSGLRATTIEKHFACLQVFSRAIGKPDIVADIRRVKPIKQRTAPESLSDNEYNALMRRVEQSGNKRNIAIVRLLANAGLRVSELVALNRDDVQISDRKGSVIVRHGKGDKERVVPLVREVRRALSEYLATRTDDEPALFLSNYNKRISVRSVQHMLAQYGTHPHALRHTFCRRLVARGVDITTVADLAGHSDINVTRRYSRSSEDERIKAMELTFD